MPEVWFARHGECIANVGEATLHAWEAPLTPRGYEQARCIAAYLQDWAGDRQVKVITSSYRRATETAKTVYEAFHERTSQKRSFETWKKVKEFNCLSLPAGKRTTAAERSHLVAEFWQRGDPMFTHGGKTESFDAFISRVQGVLRRLGEFQEDQLVVVFSHHLFIQAVEWLIEGKMKGTSPQREEMSDFYQMLKRRDKAVPNGAIVQTHLNQARRKLLNLQTSHLTDIMLPVAPR
ncbi:MAG TPA: histidine phosphatase family protein [Ktedonobacteraceae bacterium]